MEGLTKKVLKSQQHVLFCHGHLKLSAQELLMQKGATCAGATQQPAWAAILVHLQPALSTHWLGFGTLLGFHPISAEQTLQYLHGCEGLCNPHRPHIFSPSLPPLPAPFFRSACTGALASSSCS